MDLQAAFQVLVLGAVTGCISLTLTRTYVFAKPRMWLRKKEEWLDKLTTCPYCMGHWVALFWLVIFRPRPISPPFDGFLGLFFSYLVSWFAIVVVSVLVVGLIWNALANVGDPPPIEPEKEG